MYMFRHTNIAVAELLLVDGLIKLPFCIKKMYSLLQFSRNNEVIMSCKFSFKES